MRLELRGNGDGVERMEQAAVTDVQLRRFHQSLADVRVPWRQQADHERAAQDLEVSANRVIRNPERSTELGEVEYLAMEVAHHHPEPPQGLRGNRDSEGGNVPF